MKKNSICDLCHENLNNNLLKLNQIMFDNKLKIDFNLNTKIFESVKYFEDIFIQIENFFYNYIKNLNNNLKKNRYVLIKNQINKIVKTKEKSKNNLFSILKKYIKNIENLKNKNKKNKKPKIIYPKSKKSNNILKLKRNLLELSKKKIINLESISINLIRNKSLSKIQKINSLSSKSKKILHNYSKKEKIEKFLKGKKNDVKLFISKKYLKKNFQLPLFHKKLKQIEPLSNKNISGLYFKEEKNTSIIETSLRSRKKSNLYLPQKTILESQFSNLTS